MQALLLKTTLQLDSKKLKHKFTLNKQILTTKNEGNGYKLQTKNRRSIKTIKTSKTLKTIKTSKTPSRIFEPFKIPSSLKNLPKKK